EAAGTPDRTRRTGSGTDTPAAAASGPLPNPDTRRAIAFSPTPRPQLPQSRVRTTPNTTAALRQPLPSLPTQPAFHHRRRPARLHQTRPTPLPSPPPRRR